MASSNRIFQTCPADKRYAYSSNANGAQFFSQMSTAHYPYSNVNQVHDLCGFSSPNVPVNDVPMIDNKPCKWVHILPKSDQSDTNKGRGNRALFFPNSQSSSKRIILPQSQFLCGICYSVWNTLYELHEHMTIHVHKGNFNGNVPKCHKSSSNVKQGDISIPRHQLQLPDKYLVLSPSYTLAKPKQNVTHSLQACRPTLSEESVTKKFRCKICYILFDNQPDLDAHQKIHIRICKVCKEVLPSLDELDSHCFKLHELPCTLCDDIFETVAELNEHRLECEEEDDTENEINIACEICCQTFASETDLDEHFPVHGVERKYTCKVCKLIFRNKALYDIHYDYHIKCFHCPKRFLKRTELHRHRLRKHTKRRKRAYIKCIVCEKKFDFRRQYQLHLKIHTGEDTLLSVQKEVNVKDKEPGLFSCNHCQAKFNSGQLLKEHRISHFEKYKCPYPSCEKTFMKKSYLVRHIGIHEGHEFKCDQCDKVFLSDYKMNIHKDLVHKKLHVMICEVCGKKCANRRTFKAHKLTHDFTKNIICDKCGKMFKSNKFLRFHLKSHSKAYKCGDCGECFSRADNMKLHKRKHTKEKPYKCYYCHRTFSRKDNMKTHIKSHSQD